MNKGYFITGSDTGCGKTEVTLALMHLLRARGERVLGMKPVAAGCAPTPEGLRNDDARRIQAAGSHPVAYPAINPYAFESAIAPHIAAARRGEAIRIDSLATAFRALARQADRVVVEGVGGWRVPLGPDGAVSDLAARLALPVVLVVGLRLGCINHALLTAEAIIADGLTLAGWVANRVDPQMAAAEENLATLERMIPAPCLGYLPYLDPVSPDELASHLRLPN